jgi:pseudouridine-5'-phosphate glycosidase
MLITSRALSPAVALETTLLLHGVPATEALGLHHALSGVVRSAGAHPALVGVVKGVPTVGLTDAELGTLLTDGNVAKANTSNLGVLIAAGAHAATTVSTTMELASAAGVRVFATGGIGGVHKGFGQSLDISADLLAFTRFPVAVVTSGVKSLLDVAATREVLETLGVPVVGFQCDEFPAFYLRSLPRVKIELDATFADVGALAGYIDGELARTGRGVVICNPIPQASELNAQEFARWLSEAEVRADADGASARQRTPAILAALHQISGGKTLKANLDLVKSNASVAGQLASAIGQLHK